MENIKVNYKGYEISYNEDSEQWTCIIAGANYGRQTLKECKERIDYLIKKESAFQRFDAYYKSFGQPKIVTVTSYTDDNEYAWISDNGSRSKVKAKYLFPVTEQNKNLVKLITDKFEVVRDLEAEIKRLLKAMTQ